MFIILFIGCKNIQIDKNNMIKLPIGNSNILNHFPKEINIEQTDDGIWVSKTDSTISDNIESILKTNSDFYEKLKLIENKKLSFIPRIDNKIDNNLYNRIDSAYFVSNLISEDQYRIDIYKNGEKYKDSIGFEMMSVINYITLVSFDSKNNYIDHKTIYYENNILYEPNYLFFYMDKNSNIMLKKVNFSETSITCDKIRKIIINQNGRFIEK